MDLVGALGGDAAGDGDVGVGGAEGALVADVVVEGLDQVDVVVVPLGESNIG